MVTRIVTRVRQAKLRAEVLADRATSPLRYVRERVGVAISRWRELRELQQRYDELLARLSAFEEHLNIPPEIDMSKDLDEFTDEEVQDILWGYKPHFDKYRERIGYMGVSFLRTAIETDSDLGLFLAQRMSPMCEQVLRQGREIPVRPAPRSGEEIVSKTVMSMREWEAQREDLWRAQNPTADEELAAAFRRESVDSSWINKTGVDPDDA